MNTRNCLTLLLIAVILFGCRHSNQSSNRQDNASTDTVQVEEYDEEEEEDEYDDITTVSSPDGRICLYSRNTHSRDASWGWSDIYEVRDGDSVYTYEGLPDWEGEVSSVNHIYSLPSPRRHLYLFEAFFRISGAYGYQSYVAYELKGHDLKRTTIITDAQGNDTTEIGFEYNFADYYFRFARMLGYEYQYKWDERKRILYYPLLKWDSYYLNDKFLIYRWDGHRLYATADTVCNPRLYAPLRNYAMCLQHTKAGAIQARMDSMPDGTLRYCSWDINQDIGKQPDIILYGERKGNEFHFPNPPADTYVVTIEDTPEIRIYHSTAPGQQGELTAIYKD